MRKLLVSAVVIAVVLALAGLLNPSADQHRDAIRKTLAQRSTLDRVFGVGVLTAFASSYRTLGLASYTIVNGRVVSVGAFGIVYVVQS